MSGATNSAYCKPGDHFVPRGIASGYRDGDFAGLACPEHHPDNRFRPSGDRRIDEIRESLNVGLRLEDK